jgi:hypothetical protein
MVRRYLPSPASSGMEYEQIGVAAFLVPNEPIAADVNNYLNTSTFQIFVSNIIDNDRLR